MRYKNYDRLTPKILLFCCILSLHACSELTPLTGNYVISQSGLMGDGVCLSCKMACEGDTVIDRISAISWNEALIVVKRENEEWYIIKAREGKLSCCNWDIRYGPLSERAKDSLLLQFRYDQTNLRRQKFN